MHKKGRADAKRAKIFTKLGREIQVAAKLGGGEPDFNPRLRLAVQAARAADMPNDRIKKAIEAGTGTGDRPNRYLWGPSHEEPRGRALRLGQYGRLGRLYP